MKIYVVYNGYKSNKVLLNGKSKNRFCCLFTKIKNIAFLRKDSRER